MKKLVMICFLFLAFVAVRVEAQNEKNTQAQGSGDKKNVQTTKTTKAQGNEKKTVQINLPGEIIAFIDECEKKVLSGKVSLQDSLLTGKRKLVIEIPGERLAMKVWNGGYSTYTLQDGVGHQADFSPEQMEKIFAYMRDINSFGFFFSSEVFSEKDERKEMKKNTEKSMVMLLVCGKK